MLDLHRARILREVARRGSMTAAAQALSYTQPAVSHHVARLEAELGTPLLVRHGRGVRLTEAGRVLVEHVEAVLARLADAEEQIAAIAGLRAGRVRAAVFPTAAAGLLPDALAALRVRAPGVAVSLMEAEPPQAVAALREGEADLAVVFAYADTPAGQDAPAEQGGRRGQGGRVGRGGQGGRVGRDGTAGGSGDPAGPAVPAGLGGAGGAGGAGSAWSGGFREVPLLDDPVRVAVPSGHPLAGGGDVRLGDLAEETWASGCERCRDHLARACRAAGFAPRIAFATDDHVAVQRLVARGLAVTALPALAFALHREPGAAVLPAPELGRRRITAMVPAGPRPPAVDALLDELRAAARAAAPDRP